VAWLLVITVCLHLFGSVLWPFSLFSFIHTPQPHTPQSNSASTLSHSLPLSPSLSLSLSSTHTDIAFSQISLSLSISRFLSLSLSSPLVYGFSSWIWLAGSPFSFSLIVAAFCASDSFPIPPKDSSFDLIHASSLFLDVDEESMYIIGFI